MTLEKTFIEGLLIITPKVFNDDRGFFYEFYNKSVLEKYNFTQKFVQDNISLSQKNTVRGLHYQTGEYAQGKLCSVLKGCAIDIAVDIRYGSPTYGQYYQIELSGENHKQLWIPPGFAHGFSVISEEAMFMYKCSNFYNKASERTIIFNDKDINVDWKIGNPIISEKDLNGIPFSEIEKDFIY
jgi:dTDP-4-dehydrorhamnose 3,5-epimerase